MPGRSLISLTSMTFCFLRASAAFFWLSYLKRPKSRILQTGGAAFGEQLGEVLELGRGVAHAVVHAEQLAVLGQREAEPLAAQRELEPGAVGPAIDPGPADAGGRQQPLILVEADRARGDVELACQIGNGVGFFVRHDVSAPKGRRHLPSKMDKVLFRKI